MTEIYDPAYPTGDDEDEEVQRKDSDKTKTVSRTPKGRAASLRDSAVKAASNDKKNQSTSKVEESPKIKKASDMPPSRRKLSDRLEINGEDIKLSPKAKSSPRADNKVTPKTRKTKCQEKLSSNTQCTTDNNSVDNSSEHLIEDSINCEGSDSNSITKETKNISLHTSTENVSAKLESNAKDMSKESSGVKSEENSSDNVIVQQAFSSEAESSDSRCSGSSSTSGNQNAHKRKFGKFRLLDSELLSSSTSADQTPKQESSNTDKTQSCLDDRNDASVDKNESTSNTSELPAENCVQKDAQSITNSELSSQVNEKEEPNCEETMVRRSSRIRLIVEKKEKEKEEKGKPEKTKKGKGEQKDNLTEKKKTDKLKEMPKEDKNETKNKEELLNRSDLDANQKEKSTPNQDKKEKTVRMKGNNVIKGRAGIKIDDQKNENCEENKQKKLESHIPSPVPIQSCSPKHDGRKDLDDIPKPEKVKSRWRRSSELERGEVSGGSTPTYMLEANERISPIPSSLNNTTEAQCIPEKLKSAENDIPPYEKIEENIYLFERKRSKCKKEVRRMLCDCSLTKEEKEKNVPGCGEDCLNRLLMIECGYRCATADACTNKRFQKKEYVKTEPFKTAKKGWGLRSLEPVPQGTFVMEYVGEVLSPQEFKRRVKDYAREKTQHYYFMALKSDEIIDATFKGNLSRFINHSCDPNCETQKWTVNGELRIGFFTRRSIASGEELTFDYQFQRYGKEAQKCFCESYNCRGCIGDDKQLALKPSQNRNTVPKRRKPADDRKREIVEDLALEDEIERLSGVGGLRNREQTLMLARLMVRAEDNDTRRRLLDIIENTTEQACLRLFLDYHGLSLLWSWMVDMGDDAKSLKTQILRVLTRLPIPNKTMLLDSKILNLVERWSKSITYPKSDRENEGTETEQMSDLSNQQDMNEPSNKKLRLLEDVTSDSESPIISPHNSNSENAYLPDDNKMDSDSSSNYKNSLSFEQTNEVKCSIKDKNSEGQLDKKQEYPFKKQPLLPNPACERVNLETVGVKEENVNNSSSDEMTRYGGDSKNSEMLGKVDEESRDIPDYEDKAEVATMASKLLETWSGLKEVFRIPRLEKQKRREDEQEADRHEKEYSRNFRNQEQRWPQPKDKYNFGREKQYREKGREFENRSRDFENRSRDYDSRSREYDTRCRDFENRPGDFEGRPREFDNRTDLENRTGEFGNDSMEFSAEGGEEQKYLLESPDWREDKWYSKPNRRVNSEQEEVACRPRKTLLPTPPRLSKAERRHLFALEVQQREEEALRHQQEQEQPIAEYQPNENYAYQSDSTYPQYYDVEQPYVQQISTAPDTPMQVSGVPVSSPQGLIMPDTTSSESPAAPVARMPLLPTPTYIDSPRPQAPIPTPIPTPHPISLPAPPPVPLPTPLPALKPGSHPPPSHPGPHPPPPHAVPVPHPVSHPPPHPSPLPPPGPLSAPPPALHTAPPPALHSAPPPAIHPAPLIHSAPPPPGPHPVPHHMSHPPPHPGTHPLPHPAPHVLPHPAPHPAPQIAPHSIAPPAPLQTPASLPQSYPEQPPPTVGYPPGGVIYPQAPPAQDISQVPFVSTPAPAPLPTPAPVTVQGAPYHAEESQYINRQQIYYTHPPATAPLSDHAVAVHQPLEHHAASSVRMEPTSTMIEDRHPSPPPKIEKPVKLPPSWKTAKDAEGNIYYYHAITRQTQWDPPTADQVDDDMDLGTPTYDEPKQSKKKGTTTAAADTSSEVAKKIRELFRTKMSSFIVQCLNPYRKPDCKVGRISSTEDFKHLARKLTHFVMAKELKHCRNVEDLECNESVKHKAKDFINKYMAKFGTSYRKDKLSSPKDD